jgi:hypothetical protein
MPRMRAVDAAVAILQAEGISDVILIRLDQVRGHRFGSGRDLPVGGR